ncbi:MAG: hypothetical protein H0T79_23240 [Deltaproteobacteria bacterium]|nr:hypothetical protein [Deltaproteobacteria bacterium]
MRTALLLLLAATACTSASPSAPPPESVRDHLESPTRLFVAPDSSGGVLTARRWTRDGWAEGQVPIAIDNGGLSARLDARGRLVITELTLALAPVEIPETVIGTSARLERLSVQLAAQPDPTATTWIGDNDATLATTFDLTLDWAVTVDDTTAVLAPVHLPPIAGSILIGGDGERVDATITFAAPGRLWSWAGLVELGDFHLVLDLSTP